MPACGGAPTTGLHADGVRCCHVSQTVVFDTSCAGYRAAQRQTGSGRCGHGLCHPGIAV